MTCIYPTCTVIQPKTIEVFTVKLGKECIRVVIVCGALIETFLMLVICVCEGTEFFYAIIYCKMPPGIKPSSAHRVPTSQP